MSSGQAGNSNDKIGTRVHVHDTPPLPSSSNSNTHFNIPTTLTSCISQNDTPKSESTLSNPHKLKEISVPAGQHSNTSAIVDANGSVDVDVNINVLPQNTTKKEKSEKIAEVKSNAIQLSVADHTDKEYNCDNTLQSEALDGSMSPTSSSSFSSQGSSVAPPMKLQSNPTSIPTLNQKHGFSFHRHQHQPIPNNSAIAIATLATSNPQQQQINSNSNNAGTNNGANQKGLFTIAEAAPKQQQKDNSRKSNNKSPKTVKGRARSNSGRPRSNSVPFDFQSKNKSNKSTSPNNKTGRLRRGKWTVEEESYVARVIQDFNSGYLNAPPGTTLRTYLSDKLNCDPMRITKKFTGDSCIGKRVFHPAVRCSSNAALIDKAQSELDALERRWRKRLEMQQREAAKKQAASAAAAAAAVSGRMIHGKSIHTSLGNEGSRAVVAQTASWLDRANAILSQAHAPTRSEQENKIAKANSDEVEKEMKEVERLIHEGQETSAGLPTLLESSLTSSTTTSPISSSGAPCKRKVSDDALRIHVCPHVPKDTQLQQVPSNGDNITNFSPFLDKRMKRSLSHNNVQDHEDAATLMGFLSSVRQFAASSASTSK